MSQPFTMVKLSSAEGASLKTFAKVLIMLVRLIAILSIVFGIMIWSGTGQQFLGAHIGLGFLITLCIGLLAVIGLANRVIPLGILALVFAVLLPVVGLKQFPLAMSPNFGLIQTLHVIVVLAALGIAEALHARVAKSA